MDEARLKGILEAVMLTAGQPMTLDNFLTLFEESEKPERNEVRDALASLQEDYAERAMEVVEVGSGFRIQVRSDHAQWVGRLWEEKPQRYSRALMETLALVAYRQPVTRGEIEEVRGVAVSTSIIQTLQEREWVRVVGHREVPGRPALYGTTKAFLDYFNLKSLEDLPSLAEIRDLDDIHRELELDLKDPQIKTEYPVQINVAAPEVLRQPGFVIPGDEEIAVETDDEAVLPVSPEAAEALMEAESSGVVH